MKTAHIENYIHKELKKIAINKDVMLQDLIHSILENWVQKNGN